MNYKGIFSKYKKIIIIISIFVMVCICFIAYYIFNNSNEKSDELKDQSNFETNTLIEPSETNSTSSEIDKNLVEFKYYSSSAENVYLTGTMNNWSNTDTKMTKEGNWFTVSIPLTTNVEYKFVVDGKKTRIKQKNWRRYIII